MWIQKKYGVVPLPAATAGGNTASVAGGWNVLVSNQSSEEKIAGAKDFYFMDVAECRSCDGI